MSDVTRILCAVDFSEHARHAMDYAVALGRTWKAPILALYVHPLATPTIGGPYLASEAALPASLSEDDRADLLRALREFVAPAQAPDVHIEVRIEEAFVVPRAIVERAEGERAGLVVIGTHGRSGFERWVLGSVAERVLRTSTVPVLTVPPRAGEAGSADTLAIQRIVCPIDFGPASRRALEYAGALAQRTGAGLTVVHIVDLAIDAPELALPEFGDYRRKRFEQGRQELLDAVPDRIRKASPVTELVLVGKPHREIVRLAKEQEADLIVMGVQGRRAVEVLFFGSTTNQVARHATCPLLTVRA